MKKLVIFLVVVVSTSFFAGCVDEDGHRGYQRDGGRRSYERRHTDDAALDAWDVVRADPCRRSEYEEFAREHKNPENRRRFAERLAREGCSRRSDQRDHTHDDPYYDPYDRCGFARAEVRGMRTSGAVAATAPASASPAVRSARACRPWS